MPSPTSDHPTPARPRIRVHAAALLALAAAAAVLHRGFAAQWFYADDFGFLHLARETSLGTHLASYLGLEPRWRLWRPGQVLLIDAVYSAAGLRPVVFTALALALHFGTALLVYAAVVRYTASVALAALGALWLLAAPGVAEPVYWMSASTNTLVPSALLLAAGLLYLRAVEQPRRRTAAIAFALFAASLAFREAGYHFPLFVFGAQLALRRQLPLPRRAGAAVLHALPYGLVVLAHFALLNHVDVQGRSLLALAGSTLEHASAWLGIVFGEAPPALLLAGAATAAAAGLILGDPPTRAFVWWTLVAPFPYVVMGVSLRHLYLLQACFAAALPIAAGRGGVHARRAGLAVLAALCTLNVARLPHALQQQREPGEVCRRALAFVAAQDLSGVEHVCADALPEVLRKDLGFIVDLWLGRAVQVEIGAIVVPPFAILPGGELPAEDRTLFVHFDHQTQTLARSSRAALLGDRVAVPMLCLVEDWEVEPDQERALRRAAAGAFDLREKALVAAAPPPSAVPARGDGPNRILKKSSALGNAFQTIVFEVDIQRPCALVLSLPASLGAAGWRARVDGRDAALVRANGRFDAVFLPPGRYLVALEA